MSGIGPLRDKLRLVKSGSVFGRHAYDEAGLPLSQDSFWKSLGQFWNRSWFRRLWVIQEVVLAKKVIFVCGRWTVDFDELSQLCVEADRTAIAIKIETSNLPEEIRGHLVMIDLIEHRRLWGNQKLDSLKLLHSLRPQLISEPVDRVFGLFGIMEDWLRQSITIQYTAQARQEYWRLYVSIGKLVLEARGLDILSIAESCERPPKLPSWIPNWNSQSPTLQMPGHFTAGFKLEDQVVPKGMLLPDTSSIRLHGFELGIVVHISALITKSDSDIALAKGQKKSSAHILEAITSNLEKYRMVCPDAEEVLLERFARTLVVDAWHSQEMGISHKYTQDVREDFIWYRRYLMRWRDGQTGEAATLTADHMRKHVFPYGLSFNKAWRNRILFFTGDGRIGLGSCSCRPGDVVCVFFSARHPHLIRKVPGKESFILISSAYVDGMMYGEALDARDPEKDRDFILD